MCNCKVYRVKFIYMHIYIYSEMITTIGLVSTSITSYNYLLLCVCGENILDLLS